MSDHQRTSGAPVQRTRRNILAMGSIVAAVFGANLAMLKSASAKPKPPKGPSCFLRGTAIRTAEGDRRVEELAVGDLLPTVFGGTCPIQWIGRYRYTRCDETYAWAKDVRPVRIAASAFGPDEPHRNLYLTQWHSLFIDGVLLPAGELVNGTTITLDAADELDELEYFHIKLETHDVIYAEGAACETLLNIDEDASNFAEYLSRHGTATTEETPCAPRPSVNMRARLTSRFRSAISPWIDRRQKIDVVRDRLEERGVALCRQSALTS
jgi:hypothetical protein